MDTLNINQMLLGLVKQTVQETLRELGVQPMQISSTQTPIDENPIRGYRELAKIYNASPASLIKLVSEGKIPCRKIGNRTLFYRSEVDKALSIL